MSGKRAKLLRRQALTICAGEPDPVIRATAVNRMYRQLKRWWASLPAPEKRKGVVL